MLDFQLVVYDHVVSPLYGFPSPNFGIMSVDLSTLVLTTPLHLLYSVLISPFTFTVSPQCGIHNSFITKSHNENQKRHNKLT